MDGFYTSLFITWTKDWGSTYLFLLYLQEDIPIPNITTEKLYIYQYLTVHFAFQVWME